MWFPIDPGPIVEGGVAGIGQLEQRAAGAVQRGAAQVAAGAASDLLHLPQPVLNGLFNISGLMIGMALMVGGTILLATWLLSEALAGAADVVADVVQPAAQDVDKIVNAAGGAKGVAAVGAELL